MMRNPKSVAVSMYNHLKMMAFADYSGSFNGFLPGYMDGYCEYRIYQNTKITSEMYLLKFTQSDSIGRGRWIL